MQSASGTLDLISRALSGKYPMSSCSPSEIAYPASLKPKKPISEALFFIVANDPIRAKNPNSPLAWHANSNLKSDIGKSYLA